MNLSEGSENLAMPQVITIENTISTEAIKAMIGQLGVTEEGEPLKDAMSKLKVAIKENPEACSALLPEDIGEMVKYLYRVTGRDLELAIQDKNSKTKKGKKDAAKKIDFSDPEVMQQVLDDL